MIVAAPWMNVIVEKLLMNNKDLSPLGVLVAALKEAVRDQHKARLKVESTEAWLLKHQQESVDRGAVISKLHKAISTLSTKPAPEYTPVDKEIFDPFGYDPVDYPLANRDIKVGSCITCGSNMVTCGCKQLPVQQRPYKEY